jgi:hypothetical protein
MAGLDPAEKLDALAHLSSVMAGLDPATQKG